MSPTAQVWTPSSGSLLDKSVKAFISVGHDEYWSEGMRTNVESARDRTNNAVNLMFLASNVCWWRIHFDSNLRTFLCDKDSTHTNYYDNWRSPTGPNNHEVTLMGVEFVYPGPGLPSALTVTHPASGHWAFDHTGIANGGSRPLPGLLGYEVDGCWTGTNCIINGAPTTCPNWGTNEFNTIKLGDSTGFSECSGSEGHSYMTIYKTANGSTNSLLHGKVFATGSMRWTWGLDTYGYSYWNGSFVTNIAQQITHNVIRTFTGNATTQLP
jgi:hypothetical protein